MKGSWSGELCSGRSGAILLLVLLLNPLVASFALAQVQTHPLSQITPIDVNLNMSSFNITDLGWLYYTGGIYFRGLRGIPGLDIRDLAVSTEKLDDYAVTTPKLANDSVVWYKLALDPASLYRVSGGRMQVLGGYVGINTTPGAYALHVGGSTRIEGDLDVAGTIYGVVAGVAADLECDPPGCVSSLDIENYTIQAIDIANYNITTIKIADYAVTTTKIADAAVTSIKIAWPLLAPDGSATAPSYSFGSDPDIGMYRVGLDALGFATLGANRLTIDSGGRVGIGTTAPTHKLHVVGESNLTGHVYLSDANLYFYPWSTGGGLYLNNNNVHGVNQLAIADSSTTGSLGEGMIFPTSTAGNMRLNTVDGTNNLEFLVDSANDANLIIRNLGTGSFRVGIGTTSPGAKLEIAKVAASASEDALRIGIDGEYDARIKFFDDDDEANQYAQIIYGAGSNKLYLYNKGVGIAIDTTGNIGIGTTSPVAKLHIYEPAGGLTLKLEAASGYWADLAYYLAGSEKWGIGAEPSQGDLRIWEDIAGTDHYRLVIDKGTGRVGIGTTAPTERLDVEGNISLGAGSATETYVIKGLRSLYAGDTTEVSTTNTTWELKKQVRMAVFDSDYGTRPRWVNVVGRIHNDGTQTAYLNVTVVGCASKLIGSTTSASYVFVQNSIDVSGCADGLYDINVYLRTTAGGTAYNDLIEFYWVY